MSAEAGPSNVPPREETPKEPEREIKVIKVIHTKANLEAYESKNIKILTDYPVAQYPIDVINKYSDWLKLSERNPKSLMDIGIDNGDIFFSLMTEKWAKNFKPVVGTSECQPSITKFLKDKEQDKIPKTFDFQCLNFDHLPSDYDNVKYDVITSFWHLDRYEDQGKLFKDIYKMLNHNGVVLVVMVADCIVHELIRYMEAHGNDMVHHDLPFQPALLHPEQHPSRSFSVSEMSRLLAEAGFEAMCVEHESVIFKYTTRTGFEARAKMLNQIRDYIQAYKDAMFYDEIYEKLKDLGHVESSPKNPLVVSIPVKVINIVAKKHGSKVPKLVTTELINKEKEEEIKANQGPFEKHENIKVQPAQTAKRISQINKLV